MGRAHNRSLLEDNLTMLAMAGIAGAFVLWHQSQKKKTATIDGEPTIGTRGRFGEPPLRYTQRFDRSAITAGDRVRFKYMEHFKVRQHTGTVVETGSGMATVRAKGGNQQPDIDYRIDIQQISHKELPPKVGHLYDPALTAPGLVGCDCGTEF